MRKAESQLFRCSSTWLFNRDQKSVTCTAARHQRLHSLSPPNEDVIVTIHASGYREDTDKEPQRTVINLLPGETKELHIALQPLVTAK